MIATRDRSVAGLSVCRPESLSGKDQALLERYIAAVEVPSARLDALARARAEKLQELLAAKGVDARRVSTGGREAEGEAAVIVSLRANRQAPGRHPRLRPVGG